MLNVISFVRLYAGSYLKFHLIRRADTRVKVSSWPIYYSFRRFALKMVLFLLNTLDRASLQLRAKRRIHSDRFTDKVQDSFVKSVVINPDAAEPRYGGVFGMRR